MKFKNVKNRQQVWNTADNNAWNQVSKKTSSQLWNNVMSKVDDN